MKIRQDTRREDPKNISTIDISDLEHFQPEIWHVESYHMPPLKLYLGKGSYTKQMR